MSHFLKKGNRRICLNTISLKSFPQNPLWNLYYKTKTSYSKLARPFGRRVMRQGVGLISYYLISDLLQNQGSESHPGSWSRPGRCAPSAADAAQSWPKLRLLPSGLLHWEHSGHAWRWSRSAPPRAWSWNHTSRSVVGVKLCFQCSRASKPQTEL